MTPLPLDNSPLVRLPPRSPESHKGDFGRALLIGGSTGMAGAIGLAGMAALRGGAGLVKLAVPSDCLSTVASFEPSYMTISLPADSAGRISAAARSVLAGAIEPATALAIGPGLGRSDDLVELVAWLYQCVKQPLVVDADGLNALAQRPAALDAPGGPRILTPHPGEFIRLAGLASLAPGDRQPQAERIAERTGAVVVLKGHRTVITDGRRTAINTTGNPGMATGGTGDVLTGLITALLCQGLAPYDAARLGAHVHGLAGDLTAAALGQTGMIARDLITYLPQALASA